MNDDWKQHYIAMSEFMATKSRDPSTQVGAVIVGPDNEVRSTGYNGFPRGCDDTVPERLLRPTKYQWTEHAERNAIYNAARVGIPLKGCIMVLSVGPCLCTDCARGVIQTGIVEVIANDIDGLPENWSDDVAIGREMLAEANVVITLMK